MLVMTMLNFHRCFTWSSVVNQNLMIRLSGIAKRQLLSYFNRPDQVTQPSVPVDRPCHTHRHLYPRRWIL